MATNPHAISLADAADLTRRWRDANPAGTLKGGRFDRIAFDTLLAHTGCAGIRIYLGMHADGSWTFVLIGVDQAGNDIVTGTVDAGRGSADDGDPQQQTLPCPPFCPITASPLFGTA